MLRVLQFPLAVQGSSCPSQTDSSGCGTCEVVVIPPWLSKLQPPPLSPSSVCLMLILLFPGKDLIIHRDFWVAQLETGSAFRADLLAALTDTFVPRCATTFVLSSGAFTPMLARKKPFISALIGALVALSIISLVLSLVRVEDVTLPPTVKVSPR